ncbi:MAG: TRAP transporter large permease [Thermodesulfobacteriota bacterium]|nr:TRAP transporter large permease [Thermodesulfobacteriota bacterium]
MSPELVGAIGLGVMLILMFLGVHIAVTLALVGIAGYAVIQGVDKAFIMAGMMPFHALSSYTMALFPIYLLLGEFADISGMMEDSFRGANVLVGHQRGGLAMASIFGGGFFAAVSGSSTACSALITKLALPGLLKHNYHPKLATGALSAAGTLSNLIPPSIGLVIYAILSETSLGKLFLATFLPGVLLTLMFMIQIHIQCRLNPSLGPPGGHTSLKQKIFALKDIAPTAILFIIVMGGIWFGVYTANEAGAIGAVGAFLYALHRKRINGQTLTKVFKTSLSIAGMIFAVIISAEIFSNFIVISGLSNALASWVGGLNIPPVGVVICIMLVYIFIGTAMDTLTMILVTIPFFVPLMSHLGVDLIWFGILVVIQMELSQITPPVGLNLFVVAGMAKEKNISMGTVFSGAWPFCYTMVIFNALIIAFPKIAMFLPSLMK